MIAALGSGRKFEGRRDNADIAQSIAEAIARKALVDPKEKLLTILLYRFPHRLDAWSDKTFNKCPSTFKATNEFGLRHFGKSALKSLICPVRQLLTESNLCGVRPIIHVVADVVPIWSPKKNTRKEITILAALDQF
ncbi:hypothetical protein BH10CYA1_BH10CYA1_61830 [soil metagenome]